MQPAWRTILTAGKQLNLVPLLGDCIKLILKKREGCDIERGLQASDEEGCGVHHCKSKFSYGRIASV